MDLTSILPWCLAAVAALAVVLWNNRRTKKILRAIDRMLDDAIQGDFTDTVFDESLLSSVECKMAKYLSAVAVSTQGIEEQKDKIQALIADIFHQTRTPLSNILLYAQLLEEQQLSAKSADCVKALNSQAKKLHFLVGTMVKMSRLETGILTLHPKRAEIYPMLDEIRDQLAVKAQRKNITLSVKETDARAVFDPKWTGEAIYNIADNAVKYTPFGGSVSIEVIAYEMFCRIDVSDTGIGISEEEQAKIFERFYRSSRNSYEEGIGLGLYLSRQIIVGQKGYIRVSSEIGGGTVFSVYLPRGM